MEKYRIRLRGENEEIRYIDIETLEVGMRELKFNLYDIDKTTAIYQGEFDFLSNFKNVDIKNPKVEIVSYKHEEVKIYKPIFNNPAILECASNVRSEEKGLMIKTGVTVFNNFYFDFIN